MIITKQILWVYFSIQIRIKIELQCQKYNKKRKEMYLMIKRMIGIRKERRREARKKKHNNK